MIVDRIDHAHLYRTLSKPLSRALDWLANQDLHSLPDGRVEVEGERVYALVQHPMLRLPHETVWEAHRKYIDIHAVIEGEERIAFAPLSGMQAGTYDSERDMLPVSGEGESVILRPGRFMILMPQDAHATTLAVREAKPVWKVVMKVAVEPPR